MTVQQPGTSTSQYPHNHPANLPPVSQLAGSLWIEPWPDQVIDQLGHDPRSRYVETFWLGVLGPSTTWLLRRMADGFDANPQGFDLDLMATAGALGLGQKGGRHSPFMRSLDRCCQFGLAQKVSSDNRGKGMRVRRSVPPLTIGQTNRLPSHLQLAHRRHQEGQLHAAAPDAADREAKARRLALTLLEIGESYEAAERQLAVWKMTGPVASRALHWAQQRHRDAQAAAVASAEGSRETLPKETLPNEAA